MCSGFADRILDFLHRRSDSCLEEIDFTSMLLNVDPLLFQLLYLLYIYYYYFPA